jgi:hypothetical protein
VGNSECDANSNCLQYPSPPPLQTVGNLDHFQETQWFIQTRTKSFWIQHNFNNLALLPLYEVMERLVSSFNRNLSRTQILGLKICIFHGELLFPLLASMVTVKHGIEKKGFSKLKPLRFWLLSATLIFTDYFHDLFHYLFHLLCMFQIHTECMKCGQ